MNPDIVAGQGTAQIVEISEVQVFKARNGETFATSKTTIELIPQPGANAGPLITVLLSVPVSDATTVSELERAILGRVATCLSQLSRVETDHLLEALLRYREEAADYRL